MPNYLSEEQQAEFMKKLESQGGSPEDGALSPEAQQQAISEGAQMAAADAQTGSILQAEPEEHPEGGKPAGKVADGLLSQLGFSSIEELANAYRETLMSQGELKEMLTQLTAITQAQQNEEELDENDPEYKIKKIIREEMKPVYDRMRADARNRVIQEAWKKSASEKADLQELMPGIQEYLQGHPDLSLAEDGLDRAYDAVRSSMYRSENALMNDPEFLKRAAENEQVKKAVIEGYLQDISRNGDAIPAGITDGGNTPLTSAKKISGMEQAKGKLAAMLGVKQ